MPLRCPRCSTPPPFDPFVCTSCGDHLLTYLDEPFGPGSGVMAGAPAGGTVRGPLPPGTVGYPGTAGYPGAAPQPTGPRSANGAGSFIAKLLIGLFLALCLTLWEPVAGLLLLGLVALMLWRWRRASVLLFILAVIGAMVAIPILVEIVDELDVPGAFAPAPDYAATSVAIDATSTAVAASGTPTLPAFARTATATVIAGENRQRLARARARWRRGDNAAALAELDQALRVLPTSAEALNLRALVRVAAGDLQGADDDAEQAVTIQPSSGTYNDTHGYVLLKQGRYGEAREAYDDALNMLRGDGRTASLLGRGLALTALGRLADARTDLDAGLRQLPDADPDPQLADLEIAARRALDPLAPRPGTPSPGVSPPVPGTPVPVRSPAASPVALRGPDVVREQTP